MLRLGLVTAGRQRREGATAQQPHPVLRVAHIAPRDELESTSRCSVRKPALERHLRQIAEAVADHELGVARGRDERGDRRRGMLSVGVDHEHGVVRRTRVLDPCAHR